MFIDRVQITVKGGDGGSGCVSFRREKFVPRGGPDGGNGGAGGTVRLEVEPQMRTLLDLRFRRNYRAKDGRPGEGARKTGAAGKDTVIKVPPGTVIEDMDTGETIADLTLENNNFVAAVGGEGGKGNYIFRTARNQAPRKSTPGKPGEERKLRLVLKLIADVGLVGLPNAGKSTMLRSVSDARPVVADYPFSTLSPNLAIVRIDDMASFCMVDIPGLIEGAHKGKGLGLQFLQHVERCRVLVFVLDAVGDPAPEEAFVQLKKELELYSSRLLELPGVIALNKMDLADKADIAMTTRPEQVEVFPVSALTGNGLTELMQVLYRKVREEIDREEEEKPAPYDPFS